MSGSKIRPSRRIMVFNKKLDKFVSWEEEQAFQEIERQKQEAAKQKALENPASIPPNEDEPCLD